MSLGATREKTHLQHSRCETTRQHNMSAKIRRHPRKVHKILWKRVSLGRTGCRHSQNADHLHREKGSEMSTRATGQKDEAGREVGGVGMGRVEHLPAAQIVHHDAGEDSRHLRQQRGGRIEESSSALLTHAQCLIEASHVHTTSARRALSRPSTAKTPWRPIYIQKL